MRDYEVRHPDVAVTLLRFGNVLGDVLDSPFARLFDRAVIPTVFGFDPRLQFLDEDDAVSALAHATLNECRGTYNVAGSGVVVLSQAIALLGKINAPVIPFVGGTMAMRAARARSASSTSPPSSSGCSSTAASSTPPACTSSSASTRRAPRMQTVVDHGRQRRARGVLDAEAPYRYEAELEEFLRSRGRRDEEPPLAANGRSTRRRRTSRGRHGARSPRAAHGGPPALPRPPAAKRRAAAPRARRAPAPAAGAAPAGRVRRNVLTGEPATPRAAPRGARRGSTAPGADATA